MTESTVTLTRDAHEKMIEHARDGHPLEVCGVLGGRRGDPVRVRTVHRTENVAGNPRQTYVVDPAEQYAAMEAIEDAGDDVVGFYHSHPDGPPRPSATDAARATWPGRTYLLVDLAGDEPTVGAWRWTGDRFERQAIAVR
ncbi:MAG: desampylase [Halobacteriales archaeon]